MRAPYRELLEIGTADRFAVFRAVRAQDGLSVVLKTCGGGQSDPRGAALLRHEYELLRRLDVRGVARPLELTTVEERPTLVLEDAGRETLAGRVQGKALDIGRFFDLAIRMAEIVGAVHDRNVIHLHVCPDNFVLGEDVTLVGFSSATAVPAFAQKTGPPGALEGTLATIAPEQTGRTNRVVDHRADLYALGATFYEMLTGAPPFSARDPLELVHAHVAIAPYAPAIVNPSVPTVLSDVVLKLLAKAPEWRYQSAEALRLDLEEAARQWHARGAISKFEIGRFDVPHGLFVQGRTYGRSREKVELEQAFERATVGACEVVFISGHAGVGKTTVVRELQAAVEPRCRWLEGKGDLLRGNVPYAPIVDALGCMTSKLMNQPAEEIAALRDRVLRAVGPAGRVLTEAIPGLERLIGTPPPAPEVGPVEASNRLQLVFASFIRALGEDRATTVLFLDDLQWVDTASLELLRTVTADPDIKHILIVAAYRTEEIAAGHPVHRAIEAAREVGAHVSAIELRALDEETLLLLLRDVLRTSAEDGAPLAKLVSQKTAGNPFAVRRLLGMLYRAGTLAFNPESAEWTWDLREIASLGISDDVAELTTASLRAQSPGTQAVLKTAACIGNQFDLAVLAAVIGEPLDEVARALWDPLRDGLIVPVEGPQFAWAARSPVELAAALSPSYRFAHDRIQQAAYQLLGEGERADLHLRIGRHLWGCLPQPTPDEAICPIVDQLDRAADRMTAAERGSLADLNHRAGVRARSTSAYASALAYFQRGLELLPEDASRSQHQLWFSLQRDAAECAALSGEHALADRLIDDGLARAEGVLEKTALYAIAVGASAGRGLHDQAIRRGEEALRLLGMDLARDRLPEAIEAEAARIRGRVGERTAEDLLRSPRSEEAEVNARLQLLLNLTAPAWYASEDLFKLVSTRAARITLENGLTPDAATSFGSYAVSLALDGQYKEAHQAARLALQLTEALVNPVQESRVLMMAGGHVNPWREPLRQSVPLLRKSLRSGIESGELVFSAYAAANLVFALFTLGVDLDHVIAETATVLTHLRKVGHRWDALQVVLVRQIARRLKGLTRSPRTFDDQEFDEDSFLTATAENIPAQAVYHLLDQQAAYLLGDIEAASRASEAAGRFVSVFRSLFIQVDYYFYRCLILAAKSDESPPRERGRLAGEMIEPMKRLRVWAENAPENYLHKSDLVAAEHARIEGRETEALASYQRAIEAAGRERFRQDEALAHELCGRFHARRGRQRMAALHLGAAAEGYARWGAASKIEQLRQMQVVPLPSRLAASFGPGPALDYASLLKVIETVTGELDLDRLLEKMLRVCAEAASAERAAIVLEDEGLFVRATANAAGEVALSRTPLARSNEVPGPLIERVYRSGQAVVLRNAAREAPQDADSYFVTHRTKSALAVPIGERARGVLYFENNLSTGAFTSDRVEIFRLLSAPIAIALQNSFLFRDRQRAEAALRLLADAGSALAESLDYETTLRKVAQLAVPALADWCIVDLFEDGALTSVAFSHVDPSKMPLLAELRERYPMDVSSPQPQAIALRSAKSLIVTHVTDETIRTFARDQRHFDLVKALAPRSVMAIPLVARGRALGTVTFTTAASDRSYGPRELALAETLARRIALAVDSAQLYRDVQRAVSTRDEAIRARDEFLSVAAHELRTPLTSLHLTVHGLGSGLVPPTPENLARWVGVVDRQVRKLGRLVEELLNTVRIQTKQLKMDLEPVDLAQIVRGVADTFASDVSQASSRLTLHVPARLVGRWDRGKLEQVVVSLLSNAIKFGAGNPIEVTLDEQEGWARLVVTDHGIGIEPARLGSIFQKFERAVSSRSYGGLGLGLYVARVIVDALGGTVTAESKGLGEGTTFTVKIPCAGPRIEEWVSP